MDDSFFHERADDVLAAIVEAIEIADTNQEVSVDLLEGVLTIELLDGGEYVLNKHEPSTQIWFSSPESGASRFTYDENDDEWRNGKAITLKECLSEELAELANIDVEF